MTQAMAAVELESRQWEREEAAGGGGERKASSWEDIYIVVYIDASSREHALRREDDACRLCCRSVPVESVAACNRRACQYMTCNSNTRFVLATFRTMCARPRHGAEAVKTHAFGV